MARHLAHGPGKRLRPSLVLLSARAFGDAGLQVVALAAAVEMLHVATLVHDDIIDGAPLRRNRATLNLKWGNEGAVLMGDYLFASAFSLLSRHLPPPVLETIAETTNVICEGELTETFRRNDPSLDEAAYLDIVASKTAALFATACRTGAWVAGADEAGADALRRYGLGLGMAFQLVDDALDVDGRLEKMGKPQGTDILEGKLTLPVLHALSLNAPRERRAWIKILSSSRKTKGDLRRIYGGMIRCRSAEYTRKRAESYLVDAVDALSGVPNVEVRQALAGLARFVVERDH